MIRQTFHHPGSGATAVLEYPAGWARNTYYTITVSQPGMSDRSDRHDYDTPQEARAGAVEHQRLALADGWLMGSGQMPAAAAYTFELFNSDGEKIDCNIVSVGFPAPPLRHSSGLGPMLSGTRKIEIEIQGPVNLRSSSQYDTLILRMTGSGAVQQMAFVAEGRETRVDSICSGETSTTITGFVTETLDRHTRALAREEAIQRCVDMPVDDGAMEIWNALAESHPDASERQQAMHRVVSVRQQRREAEARAERAERERETQDRERERRRRLEQIAAAARPASRPSVPVVDPVEALKRLSGGEVPGERHKRRIKLGD